jgi:uncharacterized protein YycO
MECELKIIFGSSTKIGGKAIRGWTWSKWSHCGLLFDHPHYLSQPKVYEAVAFKGVITTSLNDFIDRYKSVAVVSVTVDAATYLNAKAIAEAELGKHYDYLAIFGIVFQRDWHNPNRWICSEYVPFVFEEAGIPLIRTDESLNRIVPQDLWLLNLPTVHLK